MSSSCSVVQVRRGENRQAIRLLLAKLAKDPSPLFCARLKLIKIMYLYGQLHFRYRDFPDDRKRKDINGFLTEEGYIQCGIRVHPSSRPNHSFLPRIIKTELKNACE